MRLPRVMCLEQAEGTAVFPAGQGAWRTEQLRPPGFPSGQILRPVGGRTDLPILPGLTSPARKSCAGQAAAKSETTCPAPVASAFCPTRYSSVPPGPIGSLTRQRTVPGRRQRKAGTGLRLCPVLPVYCLSRPAPSVLGRKSASCPKNSKRRTGQSLSVFLYPLLSV